MSLEGAGSNDLSRNKYTTDRPHVKPFLTKFPHLSKPPVISPQHGDDIFSACAAINSGASPRAGKTDNDSRTVTVRWGPAPSSWPSENHAPSHEVRDAADHRHGCADVRGEDYGHITCRSRSRWDRRVSSATQ